MISIFLILDVIFNNFYSTLFTLSYFICHSYFIKYTFKNHIYLIIFIGIIYDLIFTDILFLNSFLFLLIYFFIKRYQKKNIYALGLISLIIYFITLYLLINLYYRQIFNLTYFIKYIFINYLIFLITIFIYKKFIKK